ncbi:MAG TPA: hypothetical protein VD927_17985 [Chryseosolibacter sp.]|nr:hypothetical protein [Chryseosolibacter sp.]
MSEVTAVKRGVDKIRLQKDLGTGDGYVNVLTVRPQAQCVSYNTDRSSSLKFVIADQAYRSSDIVLTKVLEYFINESPRFFKPHSGVTQWRNERARTPSNSDQDTIRIFVNGLSFVNQPSMGMKLVALNEKFLKEKRRYLHYLQGIPEDLVNKIFGMLSRRLVRVNYTDIAVEFTADKSLFFELRFADNVKLHFKVILESDVTAFFALYKGTICLNNGIGPLHEIVSHLTNLNAGIPTGSTSR